MCCSQISLTGLTDEMILRNKLLGVKVCLHHILRFEFRFLNPWAAVLQLSKSLLTCRLGRNVLAAASRLKGVRAKWKVVDECLLHGILMEPGHALSNREPVYAGPRDRSRMVGVSKICWLWWNHINEFNFFFNFIDELTSILFKPPINK